MHTMIKLRNIKRIDRHIVCSAYVEDCKVPISISMNEDDSKLEAYTLPVGYEYCDSHIWHARRYLKTLIGKEFDTHNRTIMWY